MKLEKGQKIALATVGFIAIQSAVILASYTYGNREGFKEARVGFMKTPTEDGSISVDKSGRAVFTPNPAESNYDSLGPWNSKANRSWLENDIKQNMASSDNENRDRVRQKVASVKCVATGTKNNWSCSVRLLGDPTYRTAIVEVDPETGDWSGRGRR